MRITGLEYAFSKDDQFRRMRIVLRLLLYISFGALVSQLANLMDWLAPVDEVNASLRTVSYSLSISLPLLIPISILFSDDGSTPYDRISGCRLIAKWSRLPTVGVVKLFRLGDLRQYIGLLLIVTSMVSFGGLVLDWQLRIRDSLRSLLSIKSPITIGPLDKVGSRHQFETFSKSGVPVMSVLRLKDDYFFPFQRLEPQNILFVSIIVNNERVHDRELHDRIIKKTLEAHLLYEYIHEKTIIQSVISIKRFGGFGFATLVQSYDYLAWKLGDESFLMTSSLREVDRERIINQVQGRSRVSADSVLAMYPAFGEAQPDLVLNLQVQTGLPYASISSLPLFDYQ